MPQPISKAVVGGMTLTPEFLLVEQEDYLHDFASFTVEPRRLEHQPTNGEPVEIRWGTPASVQEFYGYVHHVEPRYADQGRNLTKVVCAGATYIFRGGLHRVWRQQSIDSIVRDVASLFYFSSDLQRYPTVEDNVVAAGIGAWEFLVEQAKKIGFGLSAKGTELTFVSRGALLLRSAALAPVLELGPTSLTEFTPLVGPAPDGGGEQFRRVAYGLDPRSGRIYSSTVGAGRFVRLQSVASTSPADAGAQLAGSERAARHLYQAKAEALGDPAITQGMAVYISGVATEDAGHWYVERVEHELAGDGYRVYLTLGRDRNPELPRPLAQPVVRHVLRPSPMGDISSARPPTRLIQGTWRSGWTRRAS